MAMPECYYCKAKGHCIAATQPGSVVCMINRMRYGGSHADAAPPRTETVYCQFCGQPLKVIVQKRFCNNTRCLNRYNDV